MTHKPYDPEAAVAEYEALFLPEGIKADNPREQEMADVVLAAHRHAHLKWLRAALDAACRAGKREAEDECEKQHGRVNTYVARADGVGL